jgi:hypothetical protein
MAGRQPDYQLWGLDKETEQKSRIGAAWNEDKGRISIKLDPFVTLTNNGSLVLSLFPVNERDKERWAKLREANKAAGHDDNGDAIPF